MGTPQQNGRVERKHRHILNTARALRFQANLPTEFWGFGALTAGYLINRTPTPLLQGKTPFEVLYNRPPPLDHLRVFGCVCYVHNQKHGGDKFENRGNKSIFIGYPFAKKGWRVYNIETGRVTVSRDVVFLETEFGFSSLPISVTPTELLEQIPPVDLFEPEHMLTEIASPAPINLDASTSSGVNESDSAVTPDASSQPIPLPVVDAETISVSTDTRQDTSVITDHAPEPSVSSPA